MKNVSRWVHRAANALGLAAVVLLAASPANAQTILGNYPVTGFAPTQFLPPGGTRFAVGLTIGNQTQSISDITFRLGNPAGFSGAELTLWTSVADAPGASIHTFNNVTPSPVGVYDGLFLPSSQLFLAANTRYFLVMRENTNNGVLNMLASAPPVTPTGDGATWFNNQVSTDGGSSWSLSGNNVSFKIQGTPAESTPAVPEPSSIVLLLPALSVAALCRRRGGPSRSDDMTKAD